MLSSMTGFARCETEGAYGSLVWELRSVNHRYLEISLRLPEALRPIESAVRETLQRALTRGKVDAALRYEPADAHTPVLRLNEPLARAVIDACMQVDEMMMNPARMSAMEVLRWPGVVRSEETDMPDIADAALDLLKRTVAQLKANRDREGMRTADFIRERVAAARAESARARARRPEVLKGQREKLLTRIAELGIEADAARLAQELVHAAQRLDVDEELDRLDAHFDALLEALDTGGPAGRRLDFLMQEMNREANTLASKSGDLETTQAAMTLKVLIEQMREQVQNIE